MYSYMANANLLGLHKTKAESQELVLEEKGQ